MSAWSRVITAADCEPCEDCGDLLCPVCVATVPSHDGYGQHYANCACPGPHQDDEFEYRTAPQHPSGLEARPLDADDAS